MNDYRVIRNEERAIVLFLLFRGGFSARDYPIAEEVFEYEGGVMGSINFAGSDPDLYDGDMVRANYKDVDGIEVIITLTRDKNNRLLDLDFWKVNFSKLIRYPTPELLTLLR